jgi:hypothetical protein
MVDHTKDSKKSPSFDYSSLEFMYMGEFAWLFTKTIVSNGFSLKL